MSLQLKYFNTSEGQQPAVIDDEDADGNKLESNLKNVTVLPNRNVDGMTAGQIEFKSGISPGDTPGTYSE